MPRSAGNQTTRLARLEAQFHAFRADMLHWRLQHMRYHGSDEVKWGLVKLMREHPFHTLAAGVAFGTLAVAGMGGGQLWSLVEGWLK